MSDPTETFDFLDIEQLKWVEKNSTYTYYRALGRNFKVVDRNTTENQAMGL